MLRLRLGWYGCVVEGRSRECIQSLVGKHLGNHPLGSMIRRWEVNIKMVLRDILVYMLGSDVDGALSG
jgi:hypothetical protein